MRGLGVDAKWCDIQTDRQAQPFIVKDKHDFLLYSVFISYVYKSAFVQMLVYLNLNNCGRLADIKIIPLTQS